MNSARQQPTDDFSLLLADLDAMTAVSTVTVAATVAVAVALAVAVAVVIVVRA